MEPVMPVRYRDYTGVANWQLAKIIMQNQKGRSLLEISELVPGGMDSRDLRNVVEGRTTFHSLAFADKILMAFGLSITALDIAGEIDIIPAPVSQAPMKMAADEFWAKDIEPTHGELRDRANVLAALRDAVLLVGEVKSD